MSEADGLIWAYRIDPAREAARLDWDDLDHPPEAGFQWIHLELGKPEANRWIRERSGLSGVALEALMADETRPRSMPIDDALLLILRGVNLNPGADPDDMVAVRVWVEANRVITIRRRRLLATADLEEAVSHGRGPDSPGAFVAALAERLVDRMASVIGALDESLDEIEEQAMGGEIRDARSSLAEVRRQAIGLRRYLAPQRDALQRLTAERLPWLDEGDRLALREILDRTMRYVEDLEAARERAAVAQEQIASQLAEQMNNRMYALSIVAGIFLPLSFATGLLGINVAGIPGSETPWAFIAVCTSLTILGVGEIVLFRRLRWL